MEEKIRVVTVILLICISFILGFLVCDFLTDTEVIVNMSGGELYFDEDGNPRQEALEQTNIERITVDERAYMININTASEGEISDLPGIGEKTAEKIIKYRENSPFADISDIMKVDGIGEKTFENIKEYIFVG